MASTNPYSVSDDGQRVSGNGVIFTVSDINEKLPSGVSVETLSEGCSCEDTQYTDTRYLDSGDKWRLKMCNKCGGVWGWHDARADYL